MNPDEAVARAWKMAEEGADVVDIGAESTRPGATPLSPEEEWQRLGPVLEKLMKNKPPVEISIDTRHYETAAKAVELGADWINDVSGLENGKKSPPACGGRVRGGCPDDNAKMINLIANHSIKIVIMHNLGIPADKNKIIPADKSALEEVFVWGRNKIRMLEDKGINRDKIIFDPGIGFGKTAEQSLELVRSAAQFKKLGVEIMYGHSRKSFLSLFTDKPAIDRDEETYKVSVFLASQGIAYLRVHDVRGNTEAVVEQLI